MEDEVLNFSNIRYYLTYDNVALMMCELLKVKEGGGRGE